MVTIIATLNVNIKMMIIVPGGTALMPATGKPSLPHGNPPTVDPGEFSVLT